MQAVIFSLFVLLCSFTVILEVRNARNIKKHKQKVQLLEEIILSLTVNELSLETRLYLSEEIDTMLKKGKIKLMHDIADLQLELFKIISQKK